MPRFRIAMMTGDVKQTVTTPELANRDSVVGWMLRNHPAVRMYLIKPMRGPSQKARMRRSLVAMDETGMGAHLAFGRPPRRGRQ